MVAGIASMPLEKFLLHKTRNVMTMGDSKFGDQRSTTPSKEVVIVIEESSLPLHSLNQDEHSGPFSKEPTR